MERNDASDDTSSRSEPAPGRRADTKLGPIGRVWSHHWTKVALLCLAAAVAVILVIWGLRLAHKSPSAGAPSPTSVPRHPALHTRPKTFVAPIPAAELTKYQQYAQGLHAANVAATRSIVAAGSGPTTTQLLPAVAAYRTAVNLYDFQLRFIQWPASLQPAITVDHTQLEALVSLLQSFSFVSPTGVGTWLSELHGRTATARAADNQIRRDLGLPASSSFP